MGSFNQKCDGCGEEFRSLGELYCRTCNLLQLPARAEPDLKTLTQRLESNHNEYQKTYNRLRAEIDKMEAKLDEVMTQNEIYKGIARDAEITANNAIKAQERSEQELWHIRKLLELERELSRELVDALDNILLAGAGALAEKEGLLQQALVYARDGLAAYRACAKGQK